MLWVVLAVVGSAWAGVATERRWGARARSATGRALEILLYTLFPLITFCGVNRLELSTGVGIGLALGYVALGVATLGAWVLGRHVLRLDRPALGAVLCAALVANTGYLGLPLSAAVLGTDQLGPAIAYDALVSAPAVLLFGFGVGAAFGTKAGEGFRERARSFVLRNPPGLALVVALIVPDSVVPDAVIDAGRAAALGLAPIGFFILGVHLRHEAADGTFSFPPPLTRPVAAAVGVRLTLAPAVMLLADTVLLDLPPSYLLQAAMPCGINCLVVAHVYGLDLKLAAAAVAWSSALVVGVASVVALV